MRFLSAASQITRLLAALTKPAKKCLVLDCDNTLWGGVIGEDGMAGISLSDEFPGRAFVEFQKDLQGIARQWNISCHQFQE